MVSCQTPVQARLDAAQMPLSLPNWQVGYAVSLQSLSKVQRSEQTDTPASGAPHVRQLLPASHGCPQAFAKVLHAPP
jgi:hypothetical protein